MASCYRGRKRQKQSDSITCVGCSSNLDESSYAQIKKSTCAVDDCEHILCIGCFGRAQGERSADIKLTCSSESCSRSSREWSIVEFKSGEHQKPIEQKIALSTNKEGLWNDIPSSSSHQWGVHIVKIVPWSLRWKGNNIFCCSVEYQRVGYW